MANENLSNAKSAKNDEFYTQFADIEKEMNAYLDFNPDVFRGKTVLLPCDDPEWSNFTKWFVLNFKKIGLKKLISTSYAPDSRAINMLSGPTEFERKSKKFDKSKTTARGKIFTLSRDVSGDGRIDFDDIEWDYLEGDGDFRSDEVKRLRDEADIIVTNPPFSLFRQFLSWLIDGRKQFIVLSNMNAIPYKEVFPLIQNNKMWLGGSKVGQMWFRVADGVPQKSGQIIDDGISYQPFGNINWFTNIDHGRRHQPLTLMTKAHNVKFSKHKEVRGVGYQKYENYNAIEVPFTDAIPSDHKGVMGVPLSFLGKYNPDQFEILGRCENFDLYQMKTKKYSSAECKLAYQEKFGKPGSYDLNANGVVIKDGVREKVYQRILIRHRRPTK